MYHYDFDRPYSTAWVLFNQTNAAAFKVAERRLLKLGLTPKKFGALWACRHYRGSGPLTPAEISRLIFRESQSVAGLLARMESEGLVTRVPKRKGHPFTEVKLTAKGEDLYRAGLEVMLAVSSEAMSCFSAEELEQFEKLLKKLRQLLVDEMRIELRPPPGYAPGELVSAAP
jgi:DNA-binding MarR family transcriptional regulator